MNELSKQVIIESCHLLDQSMLKIKNCLEQLEPNHIWHRPSAELNSIGNLLLHLAGNLKQWTVVGIGGKADLREREKEFSQTEEIETGVLWESLENTVEAAKTLFQGLSETQLTEPRTIQGFETSVYRAMSHTTTHFVGHTHQIIYLTRLQLGTNYQFQWSPEADRNNLPI